MDPKNSSAAVINYFGIQDFYDECGYFACSQVLRSPLAIRYRCVCVSPIRFMISFTSTGTSSWMVEGVRDFRGLIDILLSLNLIEIGYYNIIIIMTYRFNKLTAIVFSESCPRTQRVPESLILSRRLFCFWTHYNISHWVFFSYFL